MRCFIYHIILYIVFQLNIINAYCNNKCDSLINIDLYYTDFNSNSIINLDNPNTYKIPSNDSLETNVYKIIITNDSLLNLLSLEISQIKGTFDFEYCFDFKIITFLKWNSNREDTLGFGNCFVMYYNGYFYKANKNLLKLLIPYIRKDFEQNYLDFINELLKYCND